MKASELIEILQKRPDADICVIVGNDKRTFVVDGASIMAMTIFINAKKTPADIYKSKIDSTYREAQR